MIHIDRSAVAIPTSLLSSNGKLASAKKRLRDHFQLPYSQRRQIRFRFEPGVYSLGEVRESLGELFHGKCAYCESTIGAIVPLEIDRLRPRTFAQNLNGKISRDHYWWLAYEWSNIYSSCPICSRNKGKRFPVEGARAPPGIKGKKLEQSEKVLIVDPCIDDPDEHLVFSDTGIVAGRTPKGEVTIDLFGLNRRELIQELSAL